MIAWLESDAVTRPLTLASAEAPEGDVPVGRITSTIRDGELFLHAPGDEQNWIRLRWAPDDEDSSRALAPGTYVLTGYRQRRTADDGSPWIWATSSVGFRRIEVKEGETTHVELRDWIGLNTRAVFRKGKHRVGLLFLAEKKLGNSLYRNGKRIAITWQLLDDAGHVLGEGPMGYG